MTTSVMIKDSAHALLMRKKVELKEKYSIRVAIPDIATIAIEHGIHKVNEEIEKELKEISMENDKTEWQE